jgi:hypothetical protein
MRTRLPLLSFALLAAGGGLAAQGDESPWYLGFGAGINSIQANQGFEPDEGFALNGAFGYRFGEPGDGRVRFGLEAEYYYAENDLSDFPVSFGLTPDDLTTAILFGNLVGDWFWTDATSLYFGGGIGYAHDVQIFDIEDDGVAYQGKAGLRFHLGGGFSWNVGYRYVRTDDIADANDFENAQHVGEMGVTWQL